MFGTRLSRLGSVSRLGLVPKAIAILRSYGADAHVYLPGIGTVNGITAGNYLDSAGTTAASVDNPVGLSLDALQAMTLGANIAVNGGFDTDTSWTKAANWSIAGGVATSNGGTGFLQANTSPLIAGKSYEVTVTIKRYVSGAIYYPYSGSGGVATPTAVGTYTSIHVASSSNLYVYSLSFNGDIDDVIVKEIPGIHATQGTTANKPILRRGLLNQLLWSQDPSNAAWTKTTAGTGVVPVITGGFTDPFGGANASRLQLNCGGGTTSSDISYLVQFITTVNSPMTAVYYLKTNDGSTKNVTLRAGVAVFQQTEITPDWTVYAVPSSTSNDRLAILLYGNNGVQTADLLIYRAGLFQGTYTAQQIIDAGGIPLTTSAAASSTTGKYWWQFDGSNDSLSLGAPLFQMADDHVVIVGVSPQSALSSVSFFQQAGGGTPYVPALGLSSGVPIAYWRDDASTTESLSAGTAVAAGAVCVITARKVVNTKVLRQNGVQKASGATVMGISTVTSGLIGFGGGSYWNGSIYPVIAIKGTVTDSDLLTLERFVGQLSGVSGI